MSHKDLCSFDWVEVPLPSTQSDHFSDTKNNERDMDEINSILYQNNIRFFHENPFETTLNLDVNQKVTALDFSVKTIKSLDNDTQTTAILTNAIIPDRISNKLSAAHQTNSKEIFAYENDINTNLMTTKENLQKDSIKVTNSKIINNFYHLLYII